MPAPEQITVMSLSRALWSIAGDLEDYEYSEELIDPELGPPLTALDKLLDHIHEAKQLALKLPSDPLAMEAMAVLARATEHLSGGQWVAKCAVHEGHTDWVEDILREHYEKAKHSCHEALEDLAGRLTAAFSVEQAKAQARPLTDTEQRVFDMIAALPEGKGITGKEIVHKLHKNGHKIKQSTLTRHIIPKLKKWHGVANDGGGRGYYIKST